MRKPLAVAGITLAVSLGAGVAWSNIPNSSTGAITGCYSKYSGNLRVIDKQAGKKCKSSERELSWQQAGPQGPQGPAGPSGDGGSSLRVVDANGVDLGALVSGPDSDSAAIPGDPAEFLAARAVVVRRDDGTFAAYDAGNGAVPRHGELFYLTANCTGAAYVRLAELTTLTTFYGIPPLEVDSNGASVRGLSVTGATVVPTEQAPLRSGRVLGEAGCHDYTGYGYWGAEYSVKLAATASSTPADVAGPLHAVEG